ncbi:MAG: hypothetical protein CV087_15710 [Candidatus Brocadia sp. WS118]|nr:MAG: hypothetical protein CV087_15710 [Candidatus Brocadia sp. WS118]
MNEFGISLITFVPLPVKRNISLSLYLGQKILQCHASVLFMRNEGYHHGMFVHGVKFEELSKENIELMNLYCFNTLLPRFRHTFGRKPSFFVKLIFKCYSHEKFRKHVRRKINLPLIVRTNGKIMLTVVTNDLSASGLSFISFMPVEAEEILDMEVFTPSGIFFAKGKIAQQREVAGGHSYFIGVKFINISGDSKTILLHLTGT